MRVLVRLYPRRWRERYGTEFKALLEQKSLGPRDYIDIARHLVDAHLHDNAPPQRSLHMPRYIEARVSGLALLLAGMIWIAGVAERSGWWAISLTPQDSLAGSDMLRGYVPLLLLLGFAGMGLHLRRYHRARALETIVIGGTVAGLALYVLVWTSERWLATRWYNASLSRGGILAGIVVFLAAVAVLAVSSMRARILPRWSLLPLFFGVSALLTFIAGALTVLTRMQVYHNQDYLVLLFGLIWLPLGVKLLFTRGDSLIPTTQVTRTNLPAPSES